MKLTGQSFKNRYPTPEEALRWALVHMAEHFEGNKYLLAPQVDMSPSHLSKALNPYKSEDDAERRHHFPADRIAKLIEATGDVSYLLTLLDLLGYDPSRLAEIRRPQKSQAQLLEEIAERLVARDKEDTVIREQLRLVMQEPDVRARGSKQSTAR